MGKPKYKLRVEFRDEKRTRVSESLCDSYADMMFEMRQFPGFNENPIKTIGEHLKSITRQYVNSEIEKLMLSESRSTGNTKKLAEKSMNKKREELSKFNWLFDKYVLGQTGLVFNSEEEACKHWFMHEGIKGYTITIEELG